ncbi:MAG: glycosyltransferase [Parvularculaceae bacterium]
MRILVFTTLFPNAAAPSHGVFVENRLRAFRQKYDAEIKVIAPVPWFPFRHDMFGAWGRAARAPETETRDGVEILHPRYFLPPKVGMNLAPGALACCLQREAEKLIAEGWDFDLIDAHYLYPDGVAAVEAARALGKPVVVTARGSDVSLLPSYAKPSARILDAVWRADAVIAVAEALKQELVRLGAPGEKIAVLRNGVDLKTFSPSDREKARAMFGVSGLVLASVGHLIERKGHDLVIDALKHVEGATLIIAGQGPEQRRLEAQAAAAGVADRVIFLGRVAHENLRDVYSAADMLVLASSREGWPNVLLEAMACGTPCVATNVWGSGEVIRARDAGLLTERTAPAIAEAINDLAAAPPSREATRRYAEQHSWDATADGMAAIFTSLSEKAAAARNNRVAPVVVARTENKPRLIVTVDTEEQFDWDRFEVQGFRVNDPVGLEKFQAVCETAGARPVYFLTTPIMRDAPMADFFGRAMEREAADCGLHLHAWTTEPEGIAGEYYSFQKNLPRALHRDKLTSIAAEYERVFGRRARAHRAGRYGVSRGCYDLLASIGVDMDFSPSAGFDFSSRGGPDFSAMSNAPFAVEEDAWRVFVTPVCGAWVIRRTRMFVAKGGVAGFADEHANRSGRLTKPMRLSPEGATLDDLKAMTRRLVASKTPVLTLTLHSTSLTPGAGPYATDAGEADAMLHTISDYLTWFRDEIGGELTSLPALAALYGA